MIVPAVSRFGPALARVQFNVRRLMQIKNYETNRDLAIDAQVPESSLSGLINGTRGVSFAVIERLASALEVDLTELFLPPGRDNAGQASPVVVDALDSRPHEPPTSSPVVAALRAIIKNDPDSAAEAIARLIGEDARDAQTQSPDRLPADKPSRRRARRKGGAS